MIKTGGIQRIIRKVNRKVIARRLTMDQLIQVTKLQKSSPLTDHERTQVQQVKTFIVGMSTPQLILVHNFVANL